MGWETPFPGHRNLELIVTVVTQTGPVNHQTGIGASWVPTPPTKLLTTDRLWETGSKIFHCRPTGEPNRIQMIVPNPWSHIRPCLNSRGHKTRGECTKGISKEGWVAGVLII